MIFYLHIKLTKYNFSRYSYVGYFIAYYLLDIYFSWST